ncbi:MAG: hypothetical protein GX868_10365 [Actinobacteria bacterium]|nr:hypothetical protein [Actinomycetota bacterium]
MIQDRAHRHAALLTPTLRDLRTATIRWAMAHGRSLDPSTLSVIIAAQSDLAVGSRRHLHRWTTDWVLRFLFGELSSWCVEHGVARPKHAGETLLSYLAFLDDHARLARGSSPYPELHAAIVELCGLEADGRRGAGEADAMVLSLHPAAPQARRTTLHPAGRR